MTPITYAQASEFLGVANNTIAQAVERGVLTKLPREGLQQRLMKEQVALFQGRKLSFGAIDTPERRQQWEECRDFATPSIKHSQEKEVPQGPNFTSRPVKMRVIDFMGSQEQALTFYQGLQQIA